jgi:hypothetical protein
MTCTELPVNDLDGVPGWFGGGAPSGQGGPLEGGVGTLLDGPLGVLLEAVVVTALRSMIAFADIAAELGKQLAGAAAVAKRNTGEARAAPVFGTALPTVAGCYLPRCRVGE